ncbi:FadR/GntR family transcriptional regulator [Oceaniglobus trochenteri]|uniref:FadR/GntR family transcriptional regulator n=1 Tax=Oceaniglobus trochenteri TaxID=2763260 RepID=UPI001CFFA659|nr:FadR/GntR family transcriptional regulator [Oceaniglobus trochenteri]
MHIDPDQTTPAGTMANAAEKLRGYVANGRWNVGDKLPPQSNLAETLGISRSVLREAVATLKAEGLLTSRQGAGVFVAKLSSSAFRLSEDDLDQIPGIVNLLELRAAVEIEAAGLAAARRTGEQADMIRAAWVRIEDAIDDPEASIAADRDFHLTVARASDNPRFEEFLGYLRDLLIPRQRIRLQADPAVGHAGYLRMLQREHGEIEQAIRVGDVVEARAAMRRHLVDGATRYRRWAEEMKTTGSRSSG